jgi:hypothetical protein
MQKKRVPAFFSDHDVRVRAYHIWEREGRPEGNSECFWHRAIGELEAEARTKNGRGDAVPPHPGVSEAPTRSVSEAIKRD